MKTKKDSGFTVIEFCIVLIAFLIVLAATIPVMDHRLEAKDKAKILSNIKLLEVHSIAYFKKHETNSIGFYDLVGPGKPIYKLVYAHNEVYPEVIHRHEAITVQTERFGKLTTD